LARIARNRDVVLDSAYARHIGRNGLSFLPLLCGLDRPGQCHDAIGRGRRHGLILQHRIVCQGARHSSLQIVAAALRHGRAPCENQEAGGQHHRPARCE
jgi:hypothetical protein